jgi:hypothetical protein
MRAEGAERNRKQRDDAAEYKEQFGGAGHARSLYHRFALGNWMHSAAVWPAAQSH